jgi:hypothetical protein
MGEAKWRRDNPELAQAAADKDRANLLGFFEKMGVPNTYCEYDESGQVDLQSIDRKTLFNLEIGQRGNHSRIVAEAAAKAFRKVAPKAGPGMILLFIPGYDDDPRELWDIPDVAAYIRLWASLAITSENDLYLLHPQMVPMLAACGCFGPEGTQATHLPKKITEQ